MKKLCFLLVLVLMLSLGASAFAEGGTEIIVMDGIPVVVEAAELTAGESNTFRADSAGFKLPASLLEIGEEAFAGIDATRVEITENVKSIGPRAFADCDKLMTISIPATVEHIDDTALDGCKYIIAVYGETGSEAERFANDNGCVFISMNPDPNPTYRTSEPPVVLPYVAFN